MLRRHFLEQLADAIIVRVARRLVQLGDELLRQGGKVQLQAVGAWRLRGLLLVIDILDAEVSTHAIQDLCLGKGLAHEVVTAGL